MEHLPSPCFLGEQGVIMDADIPQGIRTCGMIDLPLFPPRLDGKAPPFCVFSRLVPPDPKCLHRSRQIRVGTSDRKAALESKVC
jgi:hypothetical protein